MSPSRKVDQHRYAGDGAQGHADRNGTETMLTKEALVEEPLALFQGSTARLAARRPLKVEFYLTQLPPEP
jgi:hypothetical protein